MANGSDVAALDADIATVIVDASTDARAIIFSGLVLCIALGCERAVATDGERLAHWHGDAGLEMVEAADAVVALEDDGCVALAGEACPVVILMVPAFDSDLLKGDGGSVGDGYLN